MASIDVNTMNEIVSLRNSGLSQKEIANKVNRKFGHSFGQSNISQLLIKNGLRTMKKKKTKRAYTRRAQKTPDPVKAHPYDDENYHNHVIPNMKCTRCGKKTNDL